MIIEREALFSTYVSILQFFDVIFPSWTLQIIHQKVQTDFSSIITYCHAKDHAPLLGILKTYDDSLDSRYFIMYVLNQSITNISSSPQHCPHISSLLINPFQSFFNIIGSVKMIVNNFVSMMKIIYVFVNPMIFVLNVLFTIFELIIVRNVSLEENVFKVIQQIRRIFFVFVHHVIEDIIVNSI
jgi:hypothetical protein